MSGSDTTERNATDSRWGFPSAPNSDSMWMNAVEFGGSPWKAPIDLRTSILDSVSTAAPRGGPGTRLRSRRLQMACWPRSTMVGASGGMRRRSAESVCRSFATGCCASTPALTGRAGSMGSHRAHPVKLNAVVEFAAALAEVVEEATGNTATIVRLLTPFVRAIAQGLQAKAIAH